VASCVKGAYAVCFSGPSIGRLYQGQYSASLLNRSVKLKYAIGVSVVGLSWFPFREATRSTVKTRVLPLWIKNLLAEISILISQKKKKLLSQARSNSLLYVGYSWIMISILSKECDFETANLYYKKIHYIVNKYSTFKDQTQVYLFFLQSKTISASETLLA